jgi:2-oxoglutarate ferredoxin oxidoreductase subunit alpha
VEEFLASHPITFIVEQNRDAQLKSLLTLETSIAKDKMKSLLFYSGFPLSSGHLVEEILKEIA